MADRKSQPHRVLIVTGDPSNALEVVFATIYMSVPVVHDTQAVLPTRLQTVTGESYTSPAAANLKGIRLSGPRGGGITGLPLIKKADVNVKIWKKGSLRSPRPTLSSRPWLVFCWWYALMPKSPSVWFT